MKMRIFARSRYLQKLISVGPIRSFIFDFFANQNFSRHRKAQLLRKWIALVPQVKFRFMGCLVKANALVIGNIALPLSSQLIVLVFAKQPSAERYLANSFSSVFLLIAHQNTFRKVLETSQEFTRGKVLCYWSCRFLQEQSPDAFCKKGVLRKVFAKFIGKGLCQRLYYNKVAFLRL